MNKEYNRNEIREMKIRQNKIKRIKQLRRRTAIAIATFILIICSALGLTSMLTKAQGVDEEIKVKQYSSVMVSYGSTLYDLAEEYSDPEFYDSYEDYINEVMFINHLNDSTIQAGYYLILPYYASVENI